MLNRSSKECCSTPLRCSSSLHQPLAYSPLATWSWCAFLDVCVDFLVVWLVRGQCASRSHGLPPSPSSAEVALSALSGPAALWFATRLWVPSVWPAEAVWLCWLGVIPHFILPWCIRKPLSDVTFCLPHVAREGLLIAIISSVRYRVIRQSRPIFHPPFGGSSGCLFLFHFVVSWGAPLWEACG